MRKKASPSLACTAREVVPPRAAVSMAPARRSLMKFRLTARKPRNPIVAPAHFRRAGSHQDGGRSQRQEGRRQLRREIEQLRRSPP
jgi:hypothetical protein